MESSISGGASMLGGFLVAYIIILLFSLALGITFYVFSSLGLYSHAKRHNISDLGDVARGFLDSRNIRMLCKRRNRCRLYVTACS